MIKLHSISQIEKDYPFEDATISTAMKNGAVGKVTSGVFSGAAADTKAIMNIEVGDDAGLDEYEIPSGSHVRVGDLTKIKIFEIYGYPLPATYKKNDKLVSKADGTLEVKNGTTQSPTSAPYFVIKEIIGNNQGVLVEIVAE